MSGISGVVMTYNEAENIERCLESLSFCDEIVVVDSNSTDATREIAARYTDRIICQEFLGFVKQRNFAIEQARHEWVVCLDADEALDEECQRAIRNAIDAPDAPAGFVLNRLTWFLGVWHDHGEWHPDRELRVLRRSHGRSTGQEPHDRIVVDGPTRELPGHLLHWNYLDMSDHLKKTDSFSAAAARAMHDSGQRFRLLDLLLRPPFRFFRGFVMRQGFRKGLPGFVVSVSTAYYVFMKYAKLWELEHQPPAIPPGDAQGGV